MKFFYEIALTGFVIACLIGTQYGRSQDTYSYCAQQISSQIKTAINQGGVTNYTTELQISEQGQGFFINSTVSKDCAQFVPQYAQKLDIIQGGLIGLLTLTWVLAPFEKQISDMFKRMNDANRDRPPAKPDSNQGTEPEIRRDDNTGNSNA